MSFSLKKFKSNTFAGVLLHLLLAGTTFILVAIFYFYVYLPRTTNHGETITVPNIEGKTVAEVEETLDQRLLRFEISDSTYSEKHEPLTVIKQYPHAGAKVKEGRKIFISINRGEPPAVPVPNLIDGSVVNADALLRSHQLKRGRIEIVPGAFNTVKEMKYKGKVIKPLTRVPKGSTIDLVVSEGSGHYPIEDLVNLTFEDAKLVILGKDFTLGNVTIVGDTLQRKPVVLKQKPEAGEIMRAGDPVDIWIGAPGTNVEGGDDPQSDESNEDSSI
jgi:eukaryotic-like serine/threonine-protein kinase